MQRSWSLLTFWGTTARCSPEARYDASDCFTVFSSKNEEAHHSPFLRKSLCFNLFNIFGDILWLCQDCLTRCRTILILEVWPLPQLGDSRRTRNVIKLQHDVQIIQYCSFCLIFLKLINNLLYLLMNPLIFYSITIRTKHEVYLKNRKIASKLR